MWRGSEQRAQRIEEGGSMPVSQSRYSADETVRRSEEVYRQRLRAQVESEHRGRYIAIDIDTGDYELGDDYHAAAQTLMARKPDATIGVLRVGHSAVGRMGGRAKAT